MIKNKRLIIILGLFLAVVFVIFFAKTRQKMSQEVAREVNPVIGDIQAFISSTGTVQPQNRLEIKPPINGRIEDILVKEGEKVKTGQILAWMSSTERAALLDAAAANGPDAVKYWEDVYKATPLVSPIDGEVIVSTDQPGQTVTSADVVVVLSDHLIVQAQVDETDIGRVSVGQKAIISLDAYPEIKVAGSVNHVYYESKVVNNVNIYQVDILPATVPPVFRSGMSATVNIIEKEKTGVMLIPLEAVKRTKGGSFVLVSRGPGKKPVERKIETGISDEKNMEVISGLNEKDTITFMTRKYVPTNTNVGSSPFMPGGGRR